MEEERKKWEEEQKRREEAQRKAEEEKRKKLQEEEEARKTIAEKIVLSPESLPKINAKMLNVAASWEQESGVGKGTVYEENLTSNLIIDIYGGHIEIIS